MGEKAIRFIWIGTFILGIHAYGLNTLWCRFKRTSLSDIEHIHY